MKFFSVVALWIGATGTRTVHATSIHRRVAPGDFAELNSLFENAAIRLPDTFEVNERVGIATLDMVITNLACFEISVGDVTVSHKQESNLITIVDIRVSDLALTCQMDYEYTYGVLQGDGSLLLETDNNSAFTNLQFESTDFNTSPPKGSYVEQCVADVEITRMDFEGDFVSNIVEVFQRLVRGVVERAIGDVACQELSSIGTTLVASIVDLANEKIEPYLVPLEDDLTDPLSVERGLDLPGTLSPLLFLDMENVESKLFSQTLEALDLFLGATTVSDAQDLEAQDLVINTIIRDRFLDTSRAMVVNASQLPMESPVFLDAHDRLFETTMTLNQVKILGLDSLASFQPFRKIGNLTLQNDLTWSELKIEFDMTIDIQPSSLDDAILKDPTSDGISERITMEFGVENVTVLASLLLVVDQDKFGSIQLGSLLETEEFLPCLLSVLYNTELVGLTVNPQQVQEPKLSGFISPGLDRILSDSATAAFTMYTGVLQDALPNIFQTSVRTFINDFIIQPFLADQADAKCEPVASIDGAIDFQEFFAGDQYGDIPPMLKTLLDSELLTADEEGSLQINQALIVPFTQRQSGQPGRLEMEGELMTIYSEAVPAFGLESVQLKGFNLHLEHLDSFIEPARVLDPLSAFVLSNSVHVHNRSETLQIGIQGLFAMEGDPMLATYNDVSISLNLGGSQIMADVLAKMSANSFLTFPIRDLTNMDCWLATLAASNATEKGFSLENLLLDVPAMNISMQCQNCTSDGLVNILPAVLESLKSDGVMNVLENRLLQVGTDMLQSDYVQSYMDKMLVDGSLRCPHSPSFVGGSVESNKTDVPFSLSYESLENLAFAATIVMHMSTVVVAESHQDYEDQDPLSAQLAFADDPQNPMVNFSAINDTFGEWAGFGINQIGEYLNTVLDGGDLQVNSMLRSSILSPEGALDIEFNDLRLGGGDSEIALERVRIMGLDTIETLNILEILGPQTIQNELRFKELAIEIVVSLMESNTSTSKTRGDLTFTIELEEVSMSGALFLAMSTDKLGKIKLSSIMDMKNVVPCILSAADKAALTKLRVDVASFKGIKVAGFRDNELSVAAANSAEIILREYGAKVVSSIPGFFGNTVRALMNNWMSYMILEWSSVACPSTQFELSKAAPFVDLRDLLLPASVALQYGGLGNSPYGDFFRRVLSFIKDTVLKTDPSTGLSTVNEVLVGPLTYSQSKERGSLTFPGKILSSGTKLSVGGLNAMVEFSASDARIDNLDTLGAPLKILEAVRTPYEVNHSATFGVSDRPLHLAARFLVALMGDDEIDVRNEVDVELDFYKLSLIVKTMMMVAESRFYEFPLRDVLDLNCWLATIPAPELNAQGTRIRESDISASLLEFAAAVSTLNINVSCVECSSPRMTEFAQLISSAGAQNEVTSSVNDFLNYVGALAGGEFAQVKIDRILNDAARKCPHSPLYDAAYESTAYKPFEAPESDVEASYLIMLGCLAIGFVVVVFLVIFGVRTVVRRRHKKWLGNLPPFQIRTLARNQIKERNAEAALNTTTTSLFKSPEIPLWVRWFVPFILLINVALFLSGHFSLGATVNIEAEVAGENFTVEKFFEFSIARSTIDIWNAGGHELAILILIFSGIWPYTKLFMTLALWFLPPSRVSVSRRGSILLWLDWLAKWSMVDVFVLVVSIVAFRVSISSPSVPFLPENFYSIDMMVVPLWGLYANMIAQLVSQLSSHFVVHYHRRVARSADIVQRIARNVDYEEDSKSIPPRVSLDNMQKSHVNNDEKAPFQALQKHKFSRPHRGETEKLVVRRGVNTAFNMGVLCLVVLVVVGCSVPSFSLEMLGIVGVAVEFGQEAEQENVMHSIFSVIQLLMEEARLLGNANFFGLLLLSMIFLMTVLVVPIIQSLALAHLWFVPSTPQKRSRMAVFTEILQAWQYVEVYLAAVFVSSWQLGPVSQYMINAYCDNLKTVFAQAVHYGVLSEEDAQCFSVQLTIESGFFYLVGAATILALLNTFVTKAYIQYYRDEVRQEKNVIEITNMSDSGFTNTDSDDGDEHTIDAGFSARIEPVPVLFTDTFRWILRAEASGHQVGDSDEHWNLPEARAIPYDQCEGSVIDGEYLWKDDDVTKKSKSHFPSESKPSTNGYKHPATATARRHLTFDDETSTMLGSIMDSVSSQSLGSLEWPSSISRRGNLKDDLTYATPPGGDSRMKSQPSTKSLDSHRSETSNNLLPLTSGPSIHSSSPSRSQRCTTPLARSAGNSIQSSDPSRSQRSPKSLPRSASRSISSHSHATSMRVPTMSTNDELSISERQIVERILEEDRKGLANATQDAQSEYMEETLDGEEFEEFTIHTMSEILEDDGVFEDYSIDDEPRSGIV